MHKRKPELVRQLLTPRPDENSDLSQTQALEAAVALNPDCDASYNLLANEYEKRGMREKARHVLEYCLERVHPLSGEAAHALGCLYYKQNDLEKAKRCFEICLEADEYDADAMSMLAQVCQSMSDAAGEELYNKRVVATPGTTPTLLAKAYCNLGILYAGKDEEIGYLQKSLQYKPDSFETQFCLACAKADRGEWMDAVQGFRAALSVKDDASAAGEELAGGEKDKDDRRLKALQYLYKATANYLRTGIPPEQQPKSQQATIRLFQDLMGGDNYNRLVAVQQQQRKQ